MGHNEMMREPGEDEVDVFDSTGDDSYDTIRLERKIVIDFTGQLALNVVEPPNIFDAEVKQIVRRQLMNALSGIKLGSPGSISIEVTSKSDDD